MPSVLTDLALGMAELLASVPREEGIDHQRRFAGTRNAGHAGENTDGKTNRDVAQVVLLPFLAPGSGSATTTAARDRIFAAR